MSSLPGAPQTLYLDFDGDPTALWSNRGPGGPIYFVHGPAGNDPVPAFDWDGDPNTLNATELAGLQQIFNIVAEPLV